MAYIKSPALIDLLTKKDQLKSLMIFANKFMSPCDENFLKAVKTSKSLCSLTIRKYFSSIKI